MRRGDEIVRAFMAEHKICPQDFFNSRFGEHVELRAKAINRLREAGLNINATASAMRRSRETIRYWVNASYREKEAQRSKVAHATRKNCPDRKFRKLAVALEQFYAA